MKAITQSGLAIFAITAMFFSCKQGEVSLEETAVSAAANSEISSSPATDSTAKFSHNKKFIRTADIRFRVKDVAKSTDVIENVTAKFGGLVTNTNLQSTISEKKKIKVSQDSTLESTRYTMENNITIRVPNARLDTVVRAIAREIDFLDSRQIKADDVSLQLLANQLAQNRNRNHENRLEKAIDTKGKKLHSIVAAEENLASKRETDDNKKLENLALQDQVNFSTVTLQIYQPETIKQELVAHIAVMDMRPGIGVQLVDGLKTGWYILESIIAFVAQLWSLVLIFAIGFVLYKRYIRKLKSAI